MVDIKKCKYKIVCDSREQKWENIKSKFEEGFEEKPSHHDMYRGKKSTYTEPIQYYVQEKGLKVGDYTIAVQLPNKEVVNFQNRIVVERKADLNELCCNFFDKKDEEGKTRIEREFERAKEQGIKVVLLIEEENMIDKMLSGKFFRFDKASKVKPKTFKSILRAFQARYDISIEYCNKRNSAETIHDILYYHAREYLKEIENAKDTNKANK